jgi:hypothetical protein
MSDQFTDPGTSAGINLGELEGSLLLIKPIRVEYAVKTSLGDRDATVADVHVLDGTDSGTKTALAQNFGFIQWSVSNSPA